MKEAFLQIQFIHLDLATIACLLMWYSFLGWFYESTIYSLCEQGILMNRGYFIGPYCPIYGVAVIMNEYLLEGIASPVRIVVLSAVSICAIEYITSYTLEKLFDARYWDYSNYPLNINGRISAVSGLFFGFVSLFAIKILHPFSVYMLCKLSIERRMMLAAGFFVIFIVDAVFTVVAMCNLNKKCKAIYDAIDNKLENNLDKLNEKKEALSRFRVVRRGKKLVVQIKEINQVFLDLETRYLKVYPTFRSTKYGEIIDQMRITMKEKVKETAKNQIDKIHNLVDRSEDSDS